MPKIKKVIIIDAGGVIQPDSGFDLPNQAGLLSLTQLSSNEIKQYQDHHLLNLGHQPLRVALELVAKASRGTKDVEQLLQAYKNGINLYPGAPELIKELYKNGYQVVLCTNNSDVGVEHTRKILADNGLSCVKVYGSAELHLAKPEPEIFSKVCELEKVSPDECWFIDDREENLKTAKSLGIDGIPFERPDSMETAAQSINHCREQLLKLGVVKDPDFTMPAGLNRGKYPSLFGLNQDNMVVKYNPAKGYGVVTDIPNDDGNQRKRGLYESQLAQLIVENGRPYWEPAYNKINQLFLADFDLKSSPERAQKYQAYFEKIKAVLLKEKLIASDAKTDIPDLRQALTNLFSKNFNLTNVSQFYYNVWLLSYGPEALEPFGFLTDLLNGGSPQESKSDASIRILNQFPDMAHKSDERAQAYFLAQPWLTCGPPQLRGRQARAQSSESKTWGILRDDDPNTQTLAATSHYAAKGAFSPAREHPIAQIFKAEAAAIIGGSSGTLGRNIYMLAPLLQSGLLSQKELMQYVMGFSADLVYRGHHSYEEIAYVADQVLSPLKPWFDSLRDPIKFYEQLLTEEFKSSKVYGNFLAAHQDLFDLPMLPRMKI